MSTNIYNPVTQKLDPIAGNSSQMAIEELTNVNTADLADGDILRYDNASDRWTNRRPGPSAISDNSDVDIEYPQDGEMLRYDATEEKWVNTEDSLSNISDVAITNIQDGDRIKWSDAQQKWVNGPGAKSDWSEDDPSSDAFIANKPIYGTAVTHDVTPTPTSGSDDLFTSGGAYTALDGKVDKITGKGLSSEDYTYAEKIKLGGIQAGAQVNVQVDWNATVTTDDDYIKNKPTLGSAAAVNTTHAATQGSSDVLTSGGAYTLLQGKANTANSLAGYGITNAYTKTEVDELFAEHENNVSWKTAVATYADIATTYPNPQEGWTVCCTDTNIVWRYSGGQWVQISANTIPIASTTEDGLMAKAMVTKLNGIATGAEVNQNAFSNVKVGSTTVAADGKTDTLELVGSNVTLTPDATNDKVTIGITKANVTTALGYTPPTSDTNTHRPIQVNGSEVLGNNTTALNLKAGSNMSVTNSNGTVTFAATNTNTHRPIQMNGTQILGDNTTALNLKAGSNVSLSNSSGTVTIAATDTTYSSKAAASGGTAVSLCTTGEKYNWNQTQKCVRLNINSITDPAAAFYYILQNYKTECAGYGVDFQIVNGSTWYTGQAYSDTHIDAAGRTGWGWVMDRAASIGTSRFYKAVYVYGTGTAIYPLDSNVVQNANWTVNTPSLPQLVAQVTTPDGTSRDNWCLVIQPRQIGTYWVNYIFNVYPGTNSNQYAIYCVGAFNCNMSLFTGSQSLNVDLLWTRRQ